MALTRCADIDLPAHVKPGGFEHAAVHRASARPYVAHTANDALDVIDCATDRYMHSIPNLTGVAGALVCDEQNMVFTSSRGENTVGMFSAGAEAALVKVAVGIGPNGLAYDPDRGLLLAANAGARSAQARTRCRWWTSAGGPSWPVCRCPGGRARRCSTRAKRCSLSTSLSPLRSSSSMRETPATIAHIYDVPAAGLHGPDLDTAHGRLFCACDTKTLMCLEVDSGRVLDESKLSGAPDVIFLNAQCEHLYVAIGGPDVIDVFETIMLQRIETVETERGAHTIAFDANRNKVYAFLPGTHLAAVYIDQG